MFISLPTTIVSIDATRTATILYGRTGTAEVASAWVNASNATKTGSYASASISDLYDGGALQLTNFNFNLPSTAVITGARVGFYIYATGGEVRFQSADFISGGSVVSSSQIASEVDAAWPSSVATVTFGGPGTTYNLGSLSISDVNNSDFGVQVSIADYSVPDPVVAYCGYIFVQLFFTP